MGMFKLFSEDSPVQNPNPDPSRFELLVVRQFKQYYLVEIKYFGCTSFGGNKLLVMTEDPRFLKAIDPHLLGKNVIARFEPTVTGWKMAHLSVGCDLDHIQK